VKVDNRDVLSLLEGPTNEPGLKRSAIRADKTVAACEIGFKTYREFFFQFTASLGGPCQLSGHSFDLSDFLAFVGSSGSRGCVFEHQSFESQN
jgi:hypothetical protein